MIKIKALNEVVNIDNDDEYNNSLTTEAQEQVALNEYNRALQLLLENNKEEALIVLKELINSELLSIVRKPHLRDGSLRPMLSLKYSCFKNIAGIEADFKNYHSALCNYWEAASLDDSDVMLWYKIGLIAIEIANLEVASLAFTQGLKRNKYHWPCLDHVITVLYAIPDYINCLYYISVALKQDPTYVKGLAFCKYILESIPELKNSIFSSKNEWIIDLLNAEYDTAIADILINEADELQQKWIKISQAEISNNLLNDLKLKRSLQQLSWLELGKSLMNMYNYIFDNKFNFMCHILFEGFDHFNQQYLNDFSKSASSEIDISRSSMKATSFSNNYKKINFYNYLDSSDHFLTSSINLGEDEKSLSYKVNNLDEDLYSKDFEINYSCSQDLDENNLIHMNENCKINITDHKYHDTTGSSVNDSEKSKAGNVDQSFKNNDISIKFDMKDKAQKVKKRRRSSLCFLTQWAWSSSNTKRSSRARNIGRKEYEKDGLLEETLRRIFPPSFMVENNSLSKEDLKNDDSQDTMDIYYSANGKENLTEDTKSTGSSINASPTYEDSLRYFGSRREIFDVYNFMTEYNGTKNILILIAEFTKFLCKKWNHEWSDELIELFIQSYLITRDHSSHLTLLNQNTKKKIINLEAEETLLFCELYTDKWTLKEPSILPLIGLNTLGIGLASDELGYLIFHSTQNEWNNENIISFLRLLWLQAKLFFYQGEIDTSIRTLKLLLHHMQQQYVSKQLVIKLRNCKNNSLLTIKSVQNLLQFIQRSKKVREIKYLYQENKYEELTLILKESLNMPKNMNPYLRYTETPINRDEHLRILLDSLWQLKQYEECYVWSEASFNESWHSYLNNINSTKNNEEGNKWIQTILYSLEKLNACIMEASIFIAKHLSEARLLRLVQNLINLVCHQLEVPDHTTVMTIESVLPWLLLHYILQYEEDKHRVQREKTLSRPKRTSINSESDEEEDDIPSSITILLKAHEFLGRHAWCCVNEGKLLIFILKLLIPQFRSPLYSTIKSKLREPVEQAIYCLYGYPEKSLNSSKLKIKSYDEHVKSHIMLTWDSSELLFEFYRPELLPTIESKKVDSINTDVLCLFKQICKLVPEESNPNQIIDELNEFLVGKKNEFPCIKKPLKNQISYIYYLIADYYFKAGPNQSWKRAINYYKFDLCLHPYELNSWAGLAMSTSTLMETWLNNFQPNINEEKYLREAKIAQCSYEKAVDLAPSHLTIRTEYGNFLYTVHSFCSRLLKQESDSLSMERFKIIETHKEEMLEEAEKCFTCANQIYTACQGIDEPQDERWLYHYMLAKILEKKNYEPPLFLNHYSKASQLLNENHAEYPKRISHKSPQNLAIEALEIDYRIHASILKYLEHHEGEVLKRSLATVFMEKLQINSNGSFIKQYMGVAPNLKTNQFNRNSEGLLNDVSLENKLDNKALIQNNNPNKMVFQSETNKLESRKRCSESPIYTNTKKIKSNNVSHLELMQDVLQLTNDLITQVCNKESSDQYQINSDAPQYNISNKVSSDNIKDGSNNTVCYTKIRVRESQDFEVNTNIENDTFNKGILKVQKEDSEMGNYILSKVFDECKEIGDRTRNSSRRGSQESSTTSRTSTTGNNSSTSTSDDSSSSDDTSCSSSTTNSDTESNISDHEKKNMVLNEGSFISSEKMTMLIENCLSGLELCVLRFPEHYKSIYRLAHFFFHNKKYKDLNKSKQLLLGTYECQFHNNQVIQGLFFDRKNNNFFNGIWRIPSNEIDRPGSFASHMSRCILLLMQVLKETGDSSMLIELCLQLRKTPDSDKKYLGDNERKQLSSQALTLCLQCLRNKIKIQESIEIFDTYKKRLKQVLLDIFHVYQNIKNFPEYETSELPKIRKLLEDAYLSYNSNFGMQGNIFEMAIEFCRELIRGCKTKIVGNDMNINSRAAGAYVNSMPSSDIGKSLVSNLQINNLQRKSQKCLSSGRPRGRPPSSSKSVQIISNTQMTQNQNYSNQIITKDLCLTRSNNISSSPFINSFFNKETLSSMIRSGIHTNMLEYINQVGTYQNVIRQYQSNLNTNSNIEPNTYKKETKQYLSDQNLGNSSVVENCLSSVKERRDLSIIPVVPSKSNSKPKAFDSLSTYQASSTTSASISVAKSVNKIQVPSLNQVPSLTPQSSLTSIRDISKTFSIHSSPLDSIPRAHCITNTTKDQFITLPVEIDGYRSQPNISLQHKLLSKKQQQQVYETSEEYDSMKQHKAHHLITHISSTKNNEITPYTHKFPESRGYPQSSKAKMSNFTQKTVQSNSTISPLLTKCAQNRNHTFSVISQLQQQSHLEIIPQTNIRSETENICKRTIAESNQSDLSTFVKKDSISIFELPKQRIILPLNAGMKNKKQEESKQDKVEIITLDD